MGRRSLNSSSLTAIFAVLSIAAMPPALASATANTAVQAAPSAELAVAKANDSFALDLLRSQSQGNLVLSPLSIATALGMLDAGAEGKTAKQIQHVLHVPSKAKLEAGLADLLADLPSPPSSEDSSREAPQLDIANGLWLQSGFTVEPTFLQTLHSDFGAIPQSQNFEGAPEVARKAINEWIGDRTQQIIPELLGAGTIRTTIRLFLANAVYLKASWQSEFKANETAPGVFTTANGKQRETAFMNEATSLPYGQGPNYRAVELPYRDSDLSMLAVMPVERSLGAFQRSLSAHSLQRIATSMHQRDVALGIPRFEVSEQLELEPILSKLGMAIAFSEAADLSGISRSQQLSVANVVHDADLKVDETGTIAAAATGITVEATALVELTHVVKLTLDHPFLFFLRDDRTGAILFAGRLAEPTGA